MPGRKGDPRPPLALVTGASSGIGAALASALAAKGRNLVLVARSEERLQDQAASLSSQYGIHAVVLARDLSRPGAAAALVGELEDQDLAVEELVLNAGFALSGPFAEQAPEELATMLRLNLLEALDLAARLLPGLRASPRGGLLTVSSLAAFQPVPLAAAYAASKAALASWTEAIHHELRREPIRITALCPGATRSGFAARAGLNQARYHRFGESDPAAVAACGIRAFERGRALAVPRLIEQLSLLLVRLTPRPITRRCTGWLFGTDR